MPNDKPRVLILYVDVGYGHRSASNAIVLALEKRYGATLDVVVANPFDEPTVPARIRGVQEDHTRLVHAFPQIYSLGLRVTDSELTKGIGSVAAQLVLSNAIRDILDRHQPTVVLVMHPIVTEPLLNYRKNHNENIAIVTIITDLARPHHLWFDEEVDLYLLPNRAAIGLAIARDIPADHLLVTGIPINPVYAGRPRAPKSYLRKMSLETDIFTVLVVGSRRVDNLISYLESMNESGLPLQIIAVAGGDDELHEAMGRIDWQVPAAVFGYVEDMPRLMRAADCIVTKSGGLIVAESLASGLPMLITQCNPVHEKGNAEYVVLQGAGDMVESPADIVPVLRDWLANEREVFSQRAASARRIGRGRSAHDIADIVNLLVAGHAVTSDVFAPYRQMD